MGQFTDGNSQWQGPDSLSRALDDEEEEDVSVLAFAPGDGWFVQWEDGSSEWENLPKDLHNLLNGRQKSLPRVDALTIGPRGEWFVRFRDGAWRCANQSDDCDEAIDQIHQEGAEVVHIAFGHDDAWLITYEPGQARHRRR